MAKRPSGKRATKAAKYERILAMRAELESAWLLGFSVDAAQWAMSAISAYGRDLHQQVLVAMADSAVEAMNAGHANLSAEQHIAYKLGRAASHPNPLKAPTIEREAAWLRIATTLGVPVSQIAPTLHDDADDDTRLVQKRWATHRKGALMSELTTRLAGEVAGNADLATARKNALGHLRRERPELMSAASARLSAAERRAWERECAKTDSMYRYLVEELTSWKAARRDAIPDTRSAWDGLIRARLVNLGKRREILRIQKLWESLSNSSSPSG